MFQQMNLTILVLLLVSLGSFVASDPHLCGWKWEILSKGYTCNDRSGVKRVCSACNPTGVFSVPGISAVPLKKYTYNKDVNNYSYSPTYETTPQGATADSNQLVFAKCSGCTPA